MAKWLETGLKVDGEFFPAHTPSRALSAVARKAAKDADILVNVPVAPRDDEEEDDAEEE